MRQPGDEVIDLTPDAECACFDYIVVMIICQLNVCMRIPFGTGAAAAHKLSYHEPLNLRVCVNRRFCFSRIVCSTIMIMNFSMFVDLTALCRLVGQVVFRNKMLGQYGTVVTVPYSPEDRGTDCMAADIKAALEAKTGLPLNAFCD